MADNPAYITSNPAIDAYNQANKIAQDQLAGEASLEKAGLDNAIARAGAPTKLRFMNAQADLETANAGKAQAELPYAGRLAEGHARQAIASAGKTEAELPYAGPTAAATARSAGANATTAEANAAVAPQMAAAHLRSANNAALNSEMQGFYKSLEMLNNGDVQGAQEVAAQTGHPIPDEVINNSQVRQTVTAIAKRAQDLYPNRPANQQAYIKAQMDELHQRTQRGEHPDAVMQPYTQPAAAPPLPDYATPKAGTSATERIIANLQEAYRLQNPGKELSYADAVSMAKRGSRADEQSLQRERLANSAATKDPNYMTDPQGTLERWRGQYGLAPRVPQGKGTKDQPFVASNQDQIDWFKANAPAGAVLQVPGQDGRPVLLTK